MFKFYLFLDIYIYIYIYIYIVYVYVYIYIYIHIYCIYVYIKNIEDSVPCYMYITIESIDNIEVLSFFVLNLVLYLLFQMILIQVLYPKLLIIIILQI